MTRIANAARTLAMTGAKEHRLLCCPVRWPQPRGPSETLRLPPRSSEAPHVLVLTPMNGALASTALRSGTKAKHHPSRHIETVRRRP